MAANIYFNEEALMRKCPLCYKTVAAETCDDPSCLSREKEIELDWILYACDDDKFLLMTTNNVNLPLHDTCS